MQVDEAPDDDDNVRQSYNFAPGYHGLVYRAEQERSGGEEDGTDPKNEDEGEGEGKEEATAGTTKYKLQSMQWGMRSLSLPLSISYILTTTFQVSFLSGPSAIPTMPPSSRPSTAATTPCMKTEACGPP